MTFAEMLTGEFAPFGHLSPEQVARLAAHYDRLLLWNRRLNLTRLDSLEDAVKLHYCESLFLGLHLPPGPLRVGDVGSGGGFPGFPLAVLRPECQVTLIESHQRKAVFLKEVSRVQANIQVVGDRAESIQEPYDWVVSRAVTPDDVLKLNLARNFALLVGEDDAVRLGPATKLPWGKGRYFVERST